SFQVRRLRAVDVAALAQAMFDASSIVLDLRLNGGGSGSAVVELASLFLPPEAPVLEVRTRHWQQQKEPFIIHALPEEANIDHDLEVELLRTHHWVEYRTKSSEIAVGRNKHVVVLIDKQCYSNGETFARCMQEYATATLIGKPTAGYVVAADEHDLGRGYMAIIPFAMMLSGQGTKLEGVGVQPDIEADFADLDAEQIIDRLREMKVLCRSQD
ncbi:MAG: S41 family peptidase, partial [Chloroflexota bacterium]